MSIKLVPYWKMTAAALGMLVPTMVLAISFWGKGGFAFTPLNVFGALCFLAGTMFLLNEIGELNNKAIEKEEQGVVASNG